MRLTRAEIDLSALRYNFNGIRARVGSGVKIMGIVKANAYGHGLVEVSRAFVNFGADYLGVGFLEEGITLRRAGIRIPILVLGGVLGKQVREFLVNELDITVSSVEIAEWIEHEVRASNRSKAKVHLKIDTGMERIGVRAENALPFIERVCRLPHLDVVGIYSHFATSEEKDKSFALQQLEKFRSVVTGMEAAGCRIPLRHIANSGAVLDIEDSWFNMVRPGIALYGIYPSRETSESISLRPALTLKSNVVYIKEVPPGTSVSYGRKFTTSVKTRIATVPIGYGDGYRRGLTNNSEVLINGRRYRTVGAVCMDQIMVDIGTESVVHVGDDVVLMGSGGDETISAWEIAERHGSIPYEFITGLTTRVPRTYIQEQG
jgi:alanine racemase